MRHIQQVAPPLSGVEQADPKDEIAAIFEEIVRGTEDFSGELLHDLRHRSSCGKASSHRPKAIKTELPTDILGSRPHS